VDIQITDFCPADQAEAKALILKGLEEHWGWLDLALNPDLNDIAASYAAGTFLVARQAGALVGTGALIPEAPGLARVVRMSVDTRLRRQGIGRLILAELLRRAQQAGYRRLVLETTQTWEDAIVFYRSFGFAITHYADGDVHFQMEIDA
jgi:GNAT superfamily N-acetyltransferase